ncbi:MAG: MmgE/PrpD family protein [Boseongicola sp.]
MTLTATLANFIVTAQPTEGARAVMRQSLYDWMACGIAGASEPVSAIIRAQVLAEGGASDALLFGGGKVPARAAALANGTISHALDYDDTHFAHIGHPSVAVFPAVFASGADAGEACLDAALIGAEISVRIGQWLGREHYQTGFHQTATAGAFGATAAVARLRSLNEAQIEHAIGIASTKAAGLKSQFGTMGKPLNAGLAAECGVVAADLARRGFLSNPRALDDPQGFGPTHNGAGDLTAFDMLGATWLMESVSHKLHACCHGLHAMIEALGSLNLTADNVAEVIISTHPRWLTVCNISDPTSGLEAKFSYRQAAAMVLRGLNTADTANFSEETATDPKLVDLRKRIIVHSDESASETEATVKVTTNAGNVLTARHDLMSEISLDEKWQKLRRKGRALVGESVENLLYKATAKHVNADALMDLM